MCTSLLVDVTTYKTEFGECMLPIIRIFLCFSLLSKNTKFKVYRTIIFFVASYGWEKWFLILRVERTLRVSENRVLRKMFGPERDEVTGDWRKQHIEQLIYLCFSPNIIPVIKSRRIRLAEHVACMGDRKGAYRVLVRKLEGKRTLGRPRCIWEDNTKIDL